MNMLKCGAAAGAIFCLAILSGCMIKSQSPQYYTLNAMEHPAPRPAFAPRFTLTVGPVILPDSLKRPQIAVRTGENEFRFSEFNKWAGPLQDGIKRILAENLGILLAEDGATVSTDELLFEPDYRIVVNINRFDGAPADAACLNAVWTLKDTRKAQQNIVVTQSLFSEKISGTDYLDLVSAQSRTLADLSLQMADEIKKLRKKAD